MKKAIIFAIAAAILLGSVSTPCFARRSYKIGGALKIIKENSEEIRDAITSVSKKKGNMRKLKKKKNIVR